MHLLEFSPVILVLSVCTSFAAAGNVCTDRIGAVNGPLMFRHTWQVALPREVGTHSDFMYLSVCEPLSFPASSPGAPCNGKSVCRVTDGRAEVLADLSVNASNVEMTDSWMFLKGNKCGEGHPQDFKMSIRLSCASHLGSPEYFIDRKCQVFFLWRTSAACPKEPARTEVPCSAYTYSGSHHDLTGLIKTTGGYTVEATDPSTRLVINVCSDMQPAKEMAYPPRSGACLLNDKKECKSVGQLQSGLLANDTGLYLEYAPGPESQPRPGCTELPKTVVQFRCPGRGRSRAPRLISDVNCHYYIEWETQYACSLDLLQTSPKSCKFTSEVHGVDLDLGPLQLENGYRTTEMTINGTKAVLYYNICGKSLGSGPAKCGTKKSSKSAICAEIGGHTLSLGHEEEQTLQFVDDVVTMRFTDGSECPSSPGSPWSSNIHFVCNKEQGAGQLQFGLLDKDACTYHFIWETAHACPKPREEDCVIEQGGVRIDLRPLSRSGGETPWTALGNLPSDMESSILSNVCEGLDKTTVGKDCGLGSTVCVKRSNGKSAVYGMEPSRLQYDMQTRTALLFFEGSLCWNGKKYRSMINFICKPGAVSTSPQVVREVESECLLELEWHSAVACPQAAYVGQDCRVYDDALGFELNLNPLKSSKPYEVKHGGYSFFLNVCGAADGTPCSAGSSSANAAVCQVSISSGRFWSLGQASSKLTYVDGMLNLTYTGGTPYNDPGKTPRSSMLTFLCDYEAGIGQPQFLDEANRTYAFAWYTSYACPPSSFVGCVYRDPHTNMSYDLARLNQVNPGGNWIAQQDEVDHSVVAFLSICRPLRHPFPGCSSNAAVCIMHSYHNGTTKVVVGNAGQARHAPQNISQHLSLHYDQGDPCPFKKHTNYSTLINFICDPNQEEHLLYINPGRNQCEQRFLWVTHMACPVSHLDARDSCALTTSQGTTYSLSALHLPGSFYTIVSAAGLTYELNVCGPVHGGHCASMSNTSVCVVKGGVGKQLARTNGMSLSSEDPGSLRLTYVGNYTNHSAEAFKVVVDVTCEEGTNGHHFSLLRAEPKLVVFGVSTPLACEPEPAKCIFDDVYGYQYDLTPLQLRSGNWEVYHSKSNRHFHLSFCQPLNPSPSYSCPPGVAVCETDTLHPSHLGVSWGGTYRAPMVTDKSTLLLQYPNGAPCANGQRARRTLISLICSDEQVGPRYLAESEDCELLFDFQTPAACPLKMAKGADCVVQDPRYGYVYNMSLLKNASGDYEVYAPGFTYLINICQPLKTGAAGCAGAAVCQTKPHDAQFSVDAGKPNSTLIYRNGLVTLTYAEGAGGCKGSFNRTSIITFVCDHSTIGWEGPEFVSESEDCTYTFVWRTTLACPPVVKSECSVSLGDAGIVDLSPLSDPRENYVIKTPTGTKYVINVCRSVIYSAGSACVKSAGACAVLKPHITQNIGQVQSPPVFEDGIVKIRYAAGDICNRRSSRSAPVRMQTVIEFECDHNIKAGYPILLREEGCTYYFQWRTVYACPMAEESVYDNCTVLHPLTNEEFDLSVLKSSLPVNVTDNGDTYFMSVCGPLPDNLCGPGAGMCLKQNSSNNLVSLGKANKKVHFRDGVMFVKYQDGDVCFDPSSSAARRSSVIQFVCASAGRSHLGPELLHVDNGCTYYFAWYTEMACRRVLHCVVDEGTEQYDLSPLIKSTGRHTVLNLRDPGYTYYINVCQPVHAVAPYHMLVNAGLIRLSKTTSSVESLGEVFMEPFNDFEGHVTLLYVNGSQCAYNASISNKARVIFVCDPSTTVEEPVLLDIDKDNCLYIFEWRTNLVCPEVNRKVVPGEQCVFSIPQHGLNFDLSGLKRNNSTLFEVAEPNGNRKFMLDICGRTKLSGSGCGSGSVCLVSADAESNYGMLSSFTYIQSGLKVMYTNGSTCTESEGVAHSAEVSFECDEDAGIGRPVLDHKHACHATFIWKTSLVCVADHRQCVLTSGDDMYDFGLLASVSHVRNVTDEQGNIYWLNVCSDMNADHQSVQSCPSSAAVCMRSKGHSGHDFTIGKAQSLTLSAVAPGRVDMTYGGGDPYVCHNRTSQHPTTLIQHECVTGGSSTGVLEFVMGPTPDQCLFVFRWKSRTACPIVEDVAIPEKDGILVEKRLNLAMNLSSVLSSTFNVSEQRGKDGYVYMVRLGAPVAAGIAGACVEASVCQTKGSASFYRDVGSYSTKKFVVRGSELLLEMESLGSKCGRTSKAVKSIISFECSRTAGLGSPEFLYESGKCHYLFRWATAHVCHDALIRIAGPGSDRLVGPASASSSATVGIVTAAVIVFVLASAGLYLMRNKLRTLLDLTCYKSLGAIRVPQYHYSKTTSQLRSTDENGDTELLTSGSSMNSGDDPTDPHILT